jgi:hypothetical protein
VPSDDALTPFGGLVPWAAFQKRSGVLEVLAATCPVARTSPNAAPVYDVLTSFALTVLCDGRRFVHVRRLRDVPGAAWKEYLQQRAVEVAPIFERSGIKSWTEFCVRFAHSFPQVRATVGATSRPQNFKEFLAAKDNLKPLPEDIVNEIMKLHRRWCDETDIHAEPWSM